MALSSFLLSRDIKQFFLLFMADCRVKGQAIDNSPHVKESNAIVDSGFHALESPLIPEVLDYSQWNLDSGIQSLVGFQIPRAKTQDSRFHNQNFPGFRIPYKFTRFPESEFPYIRLYNLISITFTCQVGV